MQERSSNGHERSDDEISSVSRKKMVGIRACMRGIKVGCKWVMGTGRVGLRERWEAWDDDGGWAQGRIVMERRCVRWVLMEGFGRRDGDGDRHMGVNGDDWA